MAKSSKLKILFVAGFGPVVRDIGASDAFYLNELGLSLKKDGDYRYTAELEGAKHFALWPLSQAAQSCFGRDQWPEELPVPQGWMEFDVEDVEQATQELASRGYKLLVKTRKEPWGQVVTRLLGPEGLLLGSPIRPRCERNRNR